MNRIQRSVIVALFVTSWQCLLPTVVCADPLDDKIAKIFKNKCTKCHDELRSGAGGDVDYLLDFPQVRELYINQVNPAESFLLELVPESMPKEKMRDIQWNGRLEPEELVDFRAWVLRGGPKGDSNQLVARPLITLAAERQLVIADLEMLESQNRAHTRYLTLTNLHNDARITKDQLQIYRNSVVKLLNSLSSSRSVIRPIAIDENKSIMRFDLQSLGWTPEDWDLIAKHYPYEIEDGRRDETRLAKIAPVRRPYMRADWFTFAVTQPPLYHKLIGIPQTLEELEARILGNAQQRTLNLREGDAIRAGFGNSGVSVNNRLIERHGIRGGAYWISYDFASNLGKQNIFEFPLGPPGVFQGQKERDFAFQHDGGEVIYNLPNGFQAYGLFDAKGQRINVGPTNIVHDDSMTGAAIINGISCISCHDKGMKPEAPKQVKSLDRIGEHIGERRKLPFELRKRVAQLHPSADKFSDVIERDRQRFEQAMGKAGLLSKGTEPVRVLFDQFVRNLDTLTIAAELGLSVEDLATEMEKNEETWAIADRADPKGGGLKRQLYLEDFKTIVQLTGVGAAKEFEPLRFPYFGEDPGAPNVPQPPDNIPFTPFETRFANVGVAPKGWEIPTLKNDEVTLLKKGLSISGDFLLKFTVQATDQGDSFGLRLTGEDEVAIGGEFFEGFAGGRNWSFSSPGNGDKRAALPPHANVYYLRKVGSIMTLRAERVVGQNRDPMIAKFPVKAAAIFDGIELTTNSLAKIQFKMIKLLPLQDPPPQPRAKFKQKLNWNGGSNEGWTAMPPQTQQQGMIRQGLHISGDFELAFSVTAKKQNTGFEVRLFGQNDEDAAVVGLMHNPFSNGAGWLYATPKGTGFPKSVRHNTNYYKLRKKGGLMTLSVANPIGPPDPSIDSFVVRQETVYDGISLIVSGDGVEIEDIEISSGSSP